MCCVGNHQQQQVRTPYEPTSLLLLLLSPAAGIRPQEIDILVTNCSIYCPTPSLASMLVNHFKMRQDIQSYHLGGMGCGNGVMALSLIRDLLQVCGAHQGCRMCWLG
jgi:predicted naringenin-chalcone synthase